MKALLNCHFKNGSVLRFQSSSMQTPSVQIGKIKCAKLKNCYQPIENKKNRFDLTEHGVCSMEINAASSVNIQPDYIKAIIQSSASK